MPEEKACLISTLLFYSNEAFINKLFFCQIFKICIPTIKEKLVKFILAFSNKCNLFYF